MVYKHFGFVTIPHSCFLVPPHLWAIGIYLIFADLKRITMKWFWKHFEILPISLSLVNSLRCQNASTPNHPSKDLLTISLILKVGLPFHLALSRCYFFPLLFTLDLQPRKYAPSFPSRKILLLLFFTALLFLHCFFFFFSCYSLPCCLYVLFLRWYLSPLYPATFIDSKMEVYVFSPWNFGRICQVWLFKKKKKINCICLAKIRCHTCNSPLQYFPGTDSFLVYFTGCCNMFPYTGSFPMVW